MSGPFRKTLEEEQAHSATVGFAFYPFQRRKRKIERILLYCHKASTDQQQRSTLPPVKEPEMSEVSAVTTDVVS